MKHRWLVLLASLTVTAFVVCRSSVAAESAADLAAAEAAVRKADADWAAAASSGGVDAWMAFYGAEPIVLLPEEHLVSGKELVRPAVTRLLALPRLSLNWHPVKMEMAQSGDLASLIGTYELRFGDSRGTPVSERGRLLEIWRKQTDGSWKCVVDAWNPDPPAAATSQALTTMPAVPATESTPPATASGSEPPAINPPQKPLTPEQVLAAKYGEMPIDYEKSIRQYFQEYLLDPISVQYRDITKPEMGYTTAVSGTFLMRETRDYGWTVKATINAKNSRGHYAGFKTYTFLFRGEKIVHTLTPLGGDEMK